eukprot:4044548-Pyramimonas_sp.AAC.1
MPPMLLLQELSMLLAAALLVSVVLLADALFGIHHVARENAAGISPAARDRAAGVRRLEGFLDSTPAPTRAPLHSGQIRAGRARPCSPRQDAKALQ